MGRKLLGRVKVSFTLDTAFEDAIDAFIVKHRHPSMSAALNDLIERGLRSDSAQEAQESEADALVEKVMTPEIRKALARQLHRLAPTPLHTS